MFKVYLTLKRMYLIIIVCSLDSILESEIRITLYSIPFQYFTNADVKSVSDSLCSEPVAQEQCSRISPE